MVWEKLSPRLQARLCGPVWDEGLRERFLSLAATMLSVSPNAASELTTIYVKFTVSNALASPVFAVIWIKNSKKWLVGFAMPPDFASETLELQPKNYKYSGLTHCFYLEPQNEIPNELFDWAFTAFMHVSTAFSKTLEGE